MTSTTSPRTIPAPLTWTALGALSLALVSCAWLGDDSTPAASGGGSESEPSAAASLESTDTTESDGTHTHDGLAPHTHDDDTTTTDDAASDGVVADGDLLAYLEAYDAENDNVSITVDGDTVTITGNGLPDFETGDFPNSGNPNSISAQDVEVSFTLDPTYTGEPVEVREPGFSIAGIKFEPGTAERDPDTGAPIEAFQDLLDLGLDANNAHVQPDGTYHFHGVPVPLTDADPTEHSVLVGFMHDGFPVYALYGYGDAETADGTVEEITSSWQLKEGERGDDEPEGTYDGTYTTDYVYVEGSGDLDQCNGMFTVTPEYPEGTYAYFITDEFPYISRCLMGEVTDTSVLAGPGGGAPGGGAPGPRR